MSKIESAIKIGVKQGQFGLGEINMDGKVLCTAFEQDVTIPIEEMDLLVSEIICREQFQSRRIAVPPPQTEPIKLDDNEPPRPEIIARKELTLAFKIPRGKISEIMRIMNYLQTRFQSLEIDIKATDGNISEDDYTNKILEALSQLGIDLKQS